MGKKKSVSEFAKANLNFVVVARSYAKARLSDSRCVFPSVRLSHAASY